jgi:transposase-like protein
MPKPKKVYPPEFRQRLIELVRVGRSPESLAKEFEPSAQSIRGWVHVSPARLSVSVAPTRGGRVSGVHQWPDWGVHRGHYCAARRLEIRPQRWSGSR